MKETAKKLGVSFTLLILFIALIYVSDISNLPNNIILFEGETLKLNTIFGVEVETKSSSNPNIEKIENNKAVTVGADIEKNEELDCTGTVDLDVKVFGTKVKEISVNVIENTEVVPVRKSNRCKTVYKWGISCWDV